MATTYTPNYNLAQPEVGGEIDTWGGLLNADLLTLDTTIKAVSDVANAALPKAGGTMLGALIIAPASGSAELQLNTAAAGSNHYIASRVASKVRWALNLGNTIAEGGGNAGSNFALERYDDAGTFIDAPMLIARSTGATTLSSLAVTGAATVNALTSTTSVSAATLSLSGAASVGGALTGTTANFSGRIVGGNGRIIVNAGDTTLGPFPTGLATGLDMESTTGRGQLFAYNYATAGYAPMDYKASSHNFTGAVNVTGVVTATDVVATSDHRLKTEIEPIRDAMDKLRDIVGVLYVKDGRHEAGVIAQDVQRAFPVAVHERDDGYLGVSHGQLQGLVIAALNELDQRVAALELL